MVHRGDSLAWAGLTVLEPNVGPTFRKAIYDRAVESRTTFAEALLAARPDDFDGMTGATPRRANDLIDRTLAWLDAHPVPGGEGIPERWGDWLLLAFSVADAPAPVSDELVALLGIVDDAVEVGVDLPRFLGQIQPLAKDHASAQASGVRFLTMGLSKGLTVEASIILGAEEGIIPDPRGNEDEERRLLYVGLTRAKRFSYVTWATRRTGPTARAGSPRGPGASPCLATPARWPRRDPERPDIRPQALGLTAAQPACRLSACLGPFHPGQARKLPTSRAIPRPVTRNGRPP
jgi:DNA helicase-2/ATP-dependent DNA helicase PcrA